MGIRLVEPVDLQREAWLEREMPSRRTGTSVDVPCIETIYRWKISSTRGNDAVPDSVRTQQFGRSLGCIAVAQGRTAIEALVPDLLVPWISIVAASAFLYWLRPQELTILDRKASTALNLPSSSDEDYSVADYLDYCEACVEFSRQLGISLRDLDRALFVYVTLLLRGKVLA